MDKTMCTRVSDRMNIEELIEEFHDVMKSARDKSFRTRRPSKKAMSNNRVPFVDRGNYYYAEKGKRSKTEVPKDEKQRRTARTTQNKYLKGKLVK